VKRGVINLLWATVERGLTRVVQAAVMLVFARVTDPEAVGIYNWVALGYTLYHAVAEIALRSQAVLCLNNAEDRAYIQRASHRARLFGAVLLAAILGVLALLYPERHAVVLGLLPFILVPSLTTAHIMPSAVLQYHERWRTLARSQAQAALIAFAVSLPIAIGAKSSLAMAAHVTVTEFSYFLLTRRAASTLHTPLTDVERRPPRETFHLMSVTVLTWGQNQLERVLIGAFAGAAALGTYSTAATIGRSGGDALGQAAASYVLARSANTEEKGRDRLMWRIGLASMAGAVMLAAVVLLAARFVFTPFLGPKYETSLVVAPLFAVATIPSVVSSALQVFGVAQQRSRTAVVSATVGLCFAAPIAWATTINFTAAVFLVIVKEVAVLAVFASMHRDRTSWRLLLAVTSAGALTCLAVVLLMRG